MKLNVRDKQAERKAWEEQDQLAFNCMAKPFPNNIPNFIPFVDISCYREIETEKLYFDKSGSLILA
ncbi:hypothetical protein LCGC14_2357630 [marine sediment metagenome]|uniref:Uncharacterized protein n=1 Tax=marine sediment metagenome TaxID=412755 RepID=A0A0F9F2E5_9ZZZZ